VIDKPQVLQMAEQPSAFIRLTVPRSEIQNVMGPGYGELMDTIAAQGITATGPWFTHHLSMQPDTFDFEIGVPVSAPVAPAGRVQAGRVPGITVAQTTYRGPYEGLGDAWAEFDAWIAASGHAAGPDLWERYVAGPESNADPASWRTELNRPLTN